MKVKEINESARWFAGKGRTVTGVSTACEAGGLALVDVLYADGGDERYLDIPDRYAWGPLLERLREGPVDKLSLRAAPALEGLLTPGDEWVPATDQSNTLVVVGSRLLVKAYRLLAPGTHPEIEVLAGLDGGPVPAFAGSIVWGDTAIALLQEFIPTAESGWEAPVVRAAAVLRGEAEFDASEWLAAGRVTAALHAGLHAAYPPTRATAGDLARWRSDAEDSLEEAARDDAELTVLAGEIRARLAELMECRAPELTRIHGDLHIGQLLRRPGREPLVIDFEGDPIRPLAERLRPDTPMRDLASLLRSVDHCGSAAARRAGAAPPDEWIAMARQAVLSGYDCSVDPVLLRALELAKECAELVYARRVVPEWGYAPRQGLRRLLAAA